MTTTKQRRAHPALVTIQVNRECTRMHANEALGTRETPAHPKPDSRPLASIRGSTPTQSRALKNAPGADRCVGAEAGPCLARWSASKRLEGGLHRSHQDCA